MSSSGCRHRAFRAPTIAELYSASELAADLDPETLDSLELVFLKQRGSWSAEIVLFGNYWKNGIILVFDGLNEVSYQNIGRNRALGVEASFSWLGTDRSVPAILEISRKVWPVKSHAATSSNVWSRPVGAELSIALENVESIGAHTVRD